MVLNQQMQDMLQQDIQDAETRPKEEILQEQMEGLKTAGRTVRDVAVESIPGVSEALAEKRVDEALQRGDTTGAMIEGAAGVVGVLPGIGDIAARGIRKFRRLNLNEDQLFDKRKITEKSLDQHLNLEGESSTSHYITPDGTFADAVNEHDEFASEFGKDAKSIALENGLIRSGGVFRARGLEGSPISFSAEIIEGQPITREQKRVMRNAVDNVDIAYLDISDERGNIISALKSKPEIKNYIRQLEVSEPDPSYIAGPLDIGVNEGLVDGKLLKRDTMQTLDEVQKAAKKATVSSGKHLVGKKVEEGTKVGIRLNLNSKIPDGPAGIEKLQTVHKNNYDGKALSYLPFATVKNAKFNVNQKGRQSIAAKIEGLDVPEAKTKHNMASVDGEFTKENVLDAVTLYDVVEIGFNPKNTHLYIDLATGQAVKEAELATVVGNRVYATGVKYMKKSEAPQPLSASDGTPLPSEVRYKFKQGGAVPMNTMAKQMELFDEGGLMDEGGTVDPVSGNEVPPGSTQEEVRDDVPAQLSEGEFVFPADVVRYIGLETLMRMRQEAKMGLAQMEAMGQMGNSEEATIPDDLPFDMYDLEVEDDGLEMQVGGSVPAVPTPTSNAMSGTPASTVGGFVNQIQPLGGAVSNLGIAPSPVTAASATQVDPNLQGTQFTPTTVNPVTPTFQQQIGAGVVGVDFEFVEYTNEAGQTIRLRRNKATGQMIDPIPEGFSEKVKEEEQVKTTPTTGVGTQTARVSDGDAKEKEGTGPRGASISLGGKAVGPAIGGGIPGTRFAGPSRRVEGSTLFNVDFDIPGVSLLNPLSMASFMAGMISKDGPGLPEDGVARISVVDGSVGAHKVKIGSVDYNKIRKNITGNLAKEYQSAGNLAEALEDGTYNYNSETGSITDNDGNVINHTNLPDDLAKGLDKLGESIYSDVREDREGGDTMVEAGQKLSNSEKAALSMYNDKQFANFLDDKDDPAPSAPSAPSGPSFDDSAVGRGSEDRGGGGPEGGEGQPGGMGVICLTEDMKVKLNGVIDYVTNVNVGDIVGDSVVVEVMHKHMRNGYYIVNGELEITNDHPVLAKAGGIGTEKWTRTDNLVVGDTINGIKVTSLEYISKLTPTVYIGTEDDRYDVYTAGEIYTVHGQYKNITKQAA